MQQTGLIYFLRRSDRNILRSIGNALTHSADQRELDRLGESELAQEFRIDAFCRKLVSIFGARAIIAQSGRVLELSIEDARVSSGSYWTIC